MKFLVLAAAVAVFTGAQSQAAKLVVYSSYDGARLAPILEPFTQRTGIEVEVVNASSTDLIKKLEQEGSASPADLYLDKDIVYMGDAQRKGLLQSLTSESVIKNIPSHLVANDRSWFLLFYRARTVLYNVNKVNPAELTTYESLGEEKWQGQLCVRTSANSYNEGLAGYMVKHFGQPKAVSIFASWVKNFSMAPLKGDRDVIAAVAEGKCAIGIANTYYLAPIVRDDASFPVRLAFLEQKGIGAHINGVGVGITKSSKNVADANKFLTFMASKEVQEAVAGAFSQYPSNREADMAPILKTLGSFVEDTTNIEDVSNFVPAGIEAMQKAGYK